jgi:hypothetical protein
MALTANLRVVSLALAAGLVAAPALAETTSATMLLAQTEQPAQQAIQPDEQQLESFVVATVRIIDIQQQAEQRMAAAEEPAQQEEVRNQALQEIVAAVESEGLSVDEYNGIAEQLQSDPELGQAVQQRIQEEAGL